MTGSNPTGFNPSVITVIRLKNSPKTVMITWIPVNMVHPVAIGSSHTSDLNVSLQFSTPPKTYIVIAF